MKKKKVAIIGTNGIPAQYGGFETLAEYLARFLNDEYDLYCYCAKTKEKKKLKEYLNTKLIYLPFRANGWESIIYDAISIINSLLKHDVLIVLGYTGFIGFPLKYIFRKKIILNIGGIEWQKVRAGKYTARIEILVKKWLEKFSIYMSDVIVTDNKFIYDYVINEYKKNPVLIEYGGDHAKYEPINDMVKNNYNFINNDYDLTISRAQEDMNIHILLETYKDLPERNLVVISNWQISDYGINLKNKFKNKYENIIILDSIYDLKTLNIIRSNCKLYIHSHSLCGTAPSLVEAMSLKIPILCFDVPTNRATTEEKSLYFHDVKSLTTILKNLSNEKLIKIKNDMYEIAKNRYTWNRISNLYKKCID